MAGQIQDSTFSTARWVPEVSLGVTPAANFYELNVTSAAPKRNRNRERPNVWSRSRRPHAGRIVSKEGALQIVSPLQFQNLLPVIEAFMGSATGAPLTLTGTDIEFDGTLNTIEAIAGLGIFPLAYMLRVRGATQPENNGWKGPVFVSSATALELPPGQIVTEAAGASITLEVVPLLDGTIEKSGSFQWHATETDYRRTMVAAKADKYALSWQEGQYITETIDLMGRAPVKDSAGIGTTVAAGWPKSSRHFTSAEDLKRIYIGNSSLGTNELCLSKLDFAAQSNRNKVMALNLGEPKDHIMGQLFAEFTAEAYADAAAIAVQDAFDADETVFAFAAMEDPAGNGICILQTAAKGDGEIEPGERNSLVQFGGIRVDGHDPAKDENSDFYNAGTGPGFMTGIFFAPAP